MSTRTVTCVLIACDECGNAYGNDDGTPHFEIKDGGVDAAVAAAEEEVRSSGNWTATKGRHVCERCTDAQTCLMTGHAWALWLPSTLPERPGWFRFCNTCGAFDHTTDEPAGDEGERT